MRKLAIVAAMALLLGGGTAGAANVRNLVAVCGDPQTPPQETVRFCTMALNTGKLDPRAEAQVNANLGIGYFEVGRYQDAVDAYTAALRNQPRMVAALINRARAHDRLGRPQEAAADYSSAIEIDPRAADAWLGRGSILLRYGDPVRALDDLNRAVGLDPDWADARFNRGMAHMALGAHAEAVRDFSAVIERKPGDAEAHVNRGRALAALGRPGAAADFDKAVRLAPESGAAWFARGRFHDEQGRREAANADFLRAYELGHADSWLIQRVREISG